VYNDAEILYSEIDRLQRELEGAQEEIERLESQYEEDLLKARYRVESCLEELEEVRIIGQKRIYY